MKHKFNLFVGILALLSLSVYLFGRYFGVNHFDQRIVQLLYYLAISLAVFALSVFTGRLIQIRYIRHAQNLERELAMWNTISYRVKKSGETAFNKLPIGIIVLDKFNYVLWSNEYARHIFRSDLEKMPLRNINLDLESNLLEGKVKFTCEIYADTFEIIHDQEHKLLYLTNITDMVRLEEKYRKRITGMGYINIDNLEDSLADFDVQERAHYMSLIIGVIADWAEQFGIFVRAYSDHRYLILMDQGQVDRVTKSGFKLLDDIKNVIRINTVTRLSISLGLACADINIDELAKLANEQLELALKRGGDQAVVRVGDKTNFFGAKTDAAPRETKVFVRMKSEELQGLIRSSGKVIIMGHSDLDADGFGATLALYKMCKALGKESYMVLNRDSMDSTVTRIYDSIEKEYVSLKDDFIASNAASKLIEIDTLLIIVDCQYDTLVIDSSLRRKASMVAVIDHHRKGAGAIENRVYEHTSTSASSSVELVIELFEFVKEEIELDTLEATWMLLGMIVDTNHFVYRTTESTFEVAAYLSRYGASMTGVKRYLKEDVTEKLARNEFINNIDIYRERVGIALGQTDFQYERATLAKIADEIISITGIEVGFAIAYIHNGQIGISARSLGGINVQILMEKMGGGGHLNNAATQLDATMFTLESAANKLKEYLDEYFEKEETVKIILLKEIKGRGKKGEIIEVQPGYANHLVRVGQAIMASPENIKVLDQERQKAELEADQILQEMKELKKVVDSQPIEIAVHVGQEGKIFGSVSIKQIVDEFKTKTGITIDKRKINYPDLINQLGTFKIPLQLHKEVNATITVFVVEKRS